MGRKGGISSQSVNIIIRRLKSSKIKHLTVDSAVDYLRSNYPDSSRDKVQKLTYLVHKSLDIINKSKPSLSPSKSPKRFQFNGGEEEDEDEDDGDGDVRTPARKKPRKSNLAEEKLIRIENERIRKYNANQETSSTCDDDDDEEEGTVSTSEDAIYGEEVKPEFDLMKSMLRANYSGMKPAANLEQEVEVGEKPNRKLMNMNANVNASAGTNVIQGGGGERGKGSSLGGVEEKGKEYEGPRFKDLGGMDAVLDDLMMDVLVPLYHPQLPLWLGVKPIAGILLHGPPGCGKSMLAHAIANETGVPFYKISATDVVSGVSGASEENIRDLFSKAYRTAPSIVFIDEIDSIASKRENLQREMERRIVTQLMTCMDESHRLLIPNDVNSKSESSDHRPGFVLVIGATNRPDAMDPALRRPGRFDREIVLGAPDENARAKILSVITHSLRLEGSLDLLNLARATPGFVGADLKALVNKAGNLAMRRIIEKKKYELLREPVPADQTNEWHKHPSLHEDLDTLSITMPDFEEAAKLVQPSLRREGFSTIPNVKWEDVGGLDSLRLVFDRYIVRRIKCPENFEEFGINLETGFLLFGPPGCGKTLIAKAVANEAGANFIHVKGPELLNKYVGESELAVRTIFTRARTCSPCIIFFDEVDALTTQRGTEGGRVVESLLTQLLTELDGGDERRGVFVIGATNRPEVIDGALLRSGRFGERLYVPLPKPEERGLILKAIGRNKPIDDDADLISIGRNEACANLSGADLYKLMNEAAMVASDEKYASTLNGSGASPPPSTIKLRHFEQVMKNISPSVSDKQVQYYQRLSESFKAA